MAGEDEPGKKRRRGIVSDSDSGGDTTQQAVVHGTQPSQGGNKDSDRAVVSSSTVPKRKASAKAMDRTFNKAPKGEDAEKYAFDLINMMKDANKKDQQANKAGKPALHRLGIIDVVTQRVVRKDTQEACIKLGVLQEIRSWMEPLPDKSFPSQKIKKSLLDALFSIRVTKNFKEAKDVRKMSLSLMNKWKSMVIREEAE